MIAYGVLDSIPGGRATSRGAQLLWAIVLSGFVGFPLKWLLMGLTAAFGAAMGFVLWIDAMVIAIIELFLRIREVRREFAEAKRAAEDTAETFKKAR